MTERLVDLFPVGTAVQIMLGNQWQLGMVVRHDFPAVWVRLSDGREWFVTNRQRIRRVVRDE